jgi:TfoX/Sxy family transcriptional regulator of competence genes
VAYDEKLAQRIRSILAKEPGLSERKMFGGIGFMVHGNMAVAANSKGGVMVRVDPEHGRELLEDPRYQPMEMRGRMMHGWLHIEPDAVASEESLREVVRHGLDYVRTLPPK